MITPPWAQVGSLKLSNALSIKVDSSRFASLGNLQTHIHGALRLHRRGTPVSRRGEHPSLRLYQQPVGKY
jgi:hypothetical protein